MDIIGFDAQINAPKAFRNIIKKAMVKKPVSTMAPRPVAPRPVSTMAPRPVAPRPVATMAPRPVAPKPVAPRPVATMAPRPVAPRPVAPAQVPLKMTAQTRSNVMPTNVKADKAPMAIVKKSGKSIPVSKLREARNPNTVQNVTAVQRSYMPVDLPFQRVTPKSRIVKLKNSPISYPVNIDMIEPAVDSGTMDYYGK